ncbi:MAG: pilin [Candidatus Omnitrophica bacterium]|nr:pilin [Candidatus Omnitrophota bacterium]
MELLIVVIIIGILATVAIPQFGNFTEKARGAEALANMGAIRSAVMAAILEGGATGATLTTAGTNAQYRVQVSDKDWDTYTVGAVTAGGSFTIQALRNGGPADNDAITLTQSGTVAGAWKTKY